MEMRKERMEVKYLPAFWTNWRKRTEGTFFKTVGQIVIRDPIPYLRVKLMLLQEAIHQKETMRKAGNWQQVRAKEGDIHGARE